jgi:MFS family permease
MTIPMIAGLLLSSIGVGALITRFGQWKPYLIVGSVFLIAGSYLLSTIHYDTNFALVSLFMFLLGAGVGMTMQNLVLVVQNTSKPTEIGVASSGVTFFRSLGGTAGVAVMGSILGTVVPDRIANGITGLDPEQQLQAAQALGGGAIPQVAELPEFLRVVVESAYGLGVGTVFLAAVPLAVVTLIAVIFLPNVQLGTLNAVQRAKNEGAEPVGERELALELAGEELFEVAEGSVAVPTTGALQVDDEARSGRGGPGSRA